MDIDSVMKSLSAVIRVGGTAVSIVNPIAGVGMVGLGEAIPIIADKVNRKRKSIYLNSISRNCTTQPFLSMDSNYADSDIQYGIYEQMIDTIRKVVLTESDYSIYVMGIISAKAFDENRKFTQKELQMIHVLSNMNDYDFKNFLYICKQFPVIGKQSKEYLLINENDIKDEKDASKDDIVYTLKKLNALNIFKYHPTAVFDVGEDPNTVISSNFYEMNSLTNALLHIIENDVECSA